MFVCVCVVEVVVILKLNSFFVRAFSVVHIQSLLRFMNHKRD